MLNLSSRKESLMASLTATAILFMSSAEMVTYCGLEDWPWMLGSNWKFGSAGDDMPMGFGDDVVMIFK